MERRKDVEEMSLGTAAAVAPRGTGEGRLCILKGMGKALECFAEWSERQGGESWEAVFQMRSEWHNRQEW